MTSPDFEKHPAPQTETKLDEDPFAKWGETLDQTLGQKGFRSGQLVNPVVQVTRELSTFPDVSALSVLAKSFAARPILQITLFVASETLARAFRRESIGVLPTFYRRSSEVSLSLKDEWDIFWAVADAVHSTSPEDVDRHLANWEDMLDGLQDGWEFIGGIHFRSIRSNPKGLPQ